MARVSRSYYRAHVIDRAYRRYGIELAHGGYDVLLALVRQGSHIVAREHGYVTHHRLLYDGFLFIVIYDSRQDRLLTVLPHGEGLDLRLHDGFRLVRRGPRAVEKYAMRCERCGMRAAGNVLVALRGWREAHWATCRGRRVA